ncbi:DUF4232 domain-containing protein [Streptomyces alboflavus]|uniref:DUF4232 domain-containing protein n=1 Tax=Streptomyces alboflavus TaxID=67267 RepID=UPI00068E37A1|nr:DUF4232 domain-containing protein [Streptomyces alboflavus]
MRAPTGWSDDALSVYGALALERGLRFEAVSSSSKGGGSKPEGGSGSGDAKSEADGEKAGSGGAAKSEAAPNGGTKTGGQVTFCRTADLAIDAADAAPEETSGRINVTMVDRGSTTCSATGFADADIKDADNTSNPIERVRTQPRVTTLKPTHTTG